MTKLKSKCLVAQWSGLFMLLCKVIWILLIVWLCPFRHQAALSSGGVRRRGMLPIEKVTFYECLIPVVKNQIDPNFLAQYSEVQAKEEIQGVSPGLEISDSEKPDEVVGQILAQVLVQVW